STSGKLHVNTMYLCTVLRSSPTCRAIADTLTPCRCNSRIIAISPSLTNDAPLCLKGTIIGHPSPTAPQAPMLRQLTWGKFSRHIWGVFGQRSQSERALDPDPHDLLIRGWAATSIIEPCRPWL